MSRSSIAAALCLASLLIVQHGSPVAADDVKDARDALQDLGIRVLGSGLMLAEELKLSKALRDSSKSKAQFLKVYGKARDVDLQAQANKDQINKLRRQHVQYSAQLAKIDPTDVATNNRIVGALNAITGQIGLLQDKQKTLDKSAKAARSDMVASREGYIQQILDMRTLADEISETYRSKAEDSDVKVAIGRLNTATDKEYTLSPDGRFQVSLKRLKAIEDTVLSESIPLTKEDGDTLTVPVVIDGKHTVEMLVDSGASLVSLPISQARKMGLEPGATDPEIRLILADGRKIDAKLMKLPSVRVGRFTVENVDCAVLGPDAPNAEPLLGMSFLGNFKFELNAQAGTLMMVKVETPEPRRKPTRRRSSGK